MSKNLTAFAKDNTMRISPLKLANIARLIVNKKVDCGILEDLCKPGGNYKIDVSSFAID